MAVKSKAPLVLPSQYRDLQPFFDALQREILVPTEEKADTAQTSADTAQTSANTAQSAATTAQTAATAQATADAVEQNFDDLDDPLVAVPLDGDIGFFGTTPKSKGTITGAKGGNVALTNLITELENLGIIADSTT